MWQWKHILTSNSFCVPYEAVIMFMLKCNICHYVKRDNIFQKGTGHEVSGENFPI